MHPIWKRLAPLVIGALGPGIVSAQAAAYTRPVPRPAGVAFTSARHPLVAVAVTPQGVRRNASVGRMIAQTLGGALGGAVVGALAFSVFDDAGGADRRVIGDAGYTPNANTAYAIGSFVGSTGGSYFIGRGDGSRGTLAATALGTGIASAPLFFGRHEPFLPLFGVVLVAPLQGLLGTAGYQASRRVP